MEQYGWLNWVDLLSKERGEKWGEIFDWTAIEFLNMVQFFKDKKEAELKAHKQMMSKNGF